MNKKLIALAVAGACVAPAAMAQTANPVTLSGRIHLTLESVEAKPGRDRVTRLQDQASFLRVAGTEDLGGGLKAFFQLETAFSPDEGSGTFANRNSAVGLQGGWGSILFGRWDQPFKNDVDSFDPYGDVAIGGITSALNRGADNTSFDVRAANVVQYWSPKFSGFAFKIGAQTKETIGNRHDISSSLTYDGKMLDVVAAYEEHKDVSSTVSSQKGYSLGGRVALGNFKFALIGQQYKQDGRSKRKSWLGNIVWRSGGHELIYQYQTSKDGAASGSTEPDCKVHQPGYHYYFSKRTRFELYYAKTDNNSAGVCGANMSPGGPSAGQDPQGFSLGLRHLF